MKKVAEQVYDTNADNGSNIGKGGGTWANSYTSCLASFIKVEIGRYDGKLETVPVPYDGRARWLMLPNFGLAEVLAREDLASNHTKRVAFGIQYDREFRHDVVQGLKLHNGV